MRIVEIRKDGAPVASAIHANSYFLRLRGLIGRTLAKGQGLLLTPCNQIHTCMMGFPIDALYLDRAGRILKIDADLPAGKFFAPVRGARHVLELPAGEAEALALAVGDGLEGIP